MIVDSDAAGDNDTGDIEDTGGDGSAVVSCFNSFGGDEDGGNGFGTKGEDLMGS